MKRMMTALTALFLMAGTIAAAQDRTATPDSNNPSRSTPPTVEERARMATDRMTKRLGLTESQSAKAYDATLARFQRLETLAKEAREARIKEADAMKSILTTEQFMRWSQMQERGGQHHMRPGCSQGCPMKDGSACCKAGECPKQKSGKAGRMSRGPKGQGAPRGEQ